MPRLLVALVTLLILTVVVAAQPLVAPAAPAAATFDFVPATLTLAPGGAATVDLRLRDAQNLAGYEVDLTLNPAVLAVDSVERLVGTPAQPSPNRTWTGLPASADPNVTFVQTAPDTIAFGAYSFGAGPGLSGDVLLARLHVRGVGAGTSALHLSRTLAADTNAQGTTPPAVDASVTVGEGVCVTGRVNRQAYTGPGTVTVASEGGATVQAASDGSFALCGLAVGQHTITASFPGYLSRQANLNVAAGGSGLPTTMLTGGDADNNKRIGLPDLVLVAANYGAPNPTDTRGDITGDGQIGLADLTLVGANYGLAGPQPWGWGAEKDEPGAEQPPEKRMEFTQVP